MQTPILKLDTTVGRIEGPGTPPANGLREAARSADDRIVLRDRRRPRPADRQERGETFRTHLENARRPQSDEDRTASSETAWVERAEDAPDGRENGLHVDETPSDDPGSASEKDSGSAESDAAEGRQGASEVTSALGDALAASVETGHHGADGATTAAGTPAAETPNPSVTVIAAVQTEASTAMLPSDAANGDPTIIGNGAGAATGRQGGAAATSPSETLATAGTASESLSAGMLAAGAARQAGRAGSPNAAAEDGTTAATADPGASGQGRAHVTVPLSSGQSTDGQATDGGTGEATHAAAAEKATAGTASQATFSVRGETAPQAGADGTSTPAGAEGESQASAAAVRQATARAQADAVVKHAGSQTSDGPQVTAATTAAEGPAGQTGTASAGRPGAASQPAGAQTQRLGTAADQVAETIRATAGRNGRQVTVHLNPPELGRVRIVLESEGESVRGTVRVDVPETLTKLQQEAAPLMQRLQAEGIDLKRLDVMLNQEQPGGQAGQDAAFGQGRSDPDGWLPGAPGQAVASADGDVVDAGGAETAGPDGPAAAAGALDGSIDVQV